MGQERRHTAVSSRSLSETKTTPKPLTTPNTSAVEDTAFAEPAAFDQGTSADRFVSVLRTRGAIRPAPVSRLGRLGAHGVPQECEGMVLGVFRRFDRASHTAPVFCPFLNSPRPSCLAFFLKNMIPRTNEKFSQRTSKRWIMNHQKDACDAER